MRPGAGTEPEGEKKTWRQEEVWENRCWRYHRLPYCLPAARQKRNTRGRWTRKRGVSRKAALGIIKAHGALRKPHHVRVGIGGLQPKVCAKALELCLVFVGGVSSQAGRKKRGRQTHAMPEMGINVGEAASD